MEISKEDQIFLEKQGFVLCHIGLEDQNAYSFAEKGFEFELVCHPKHGWSYHVERHHLMKFDSRLAGSDSKRYFQYAEEAYAKAVISVKDYCFSGLKINNIIQTSKKQF
jgi:hypothetical protein